MWMMTVIGNKTAVGSNADSAVPKILEKSISIPTLNTQRTYSHIL